MMKRRGISVVLALALAVFLVSTLGLKAEKAGGLNEADEIEEAEYEVGKCEKLGWWATALPSFMSRFAVWDRELVLYNRKRRQNIRDSCSKCCKESGFKHSFIFGYPDACCKCTNDVSSRMLVKLGEGIRFANHNFNPLDEW